MTAYAGAKGSFGSDHDAYDQGTGSDTSDEPGLRLKLAELGLRRVEAYVRDARGEKKVSKSAEDKRKYRAQRRADGIGQYQVEVPEDEDAKRAVYAVAKAIVDDKQGTKNTRSIIFSVVSSSAMLELAQLVMTSGVNVPSIVDLIDRGEIDKIDEIRAARPTLLDDIASLAKSNPHFLSVLDALFRHAVHISDASATGLLNAAVAASGRPEILQFLEVRRRGGLRARLLRWALRGVH